MKAVILAGGGGTRLWPLSTPEKPKQFQKLVGDTTMIEQTLDRLDFMNPKDIYLAINERHLDLVKSLCPQIPEANILIEPALRDTCSCIGYAAAIIEKRTPGEVMAVIYADHLVSDKKEFQEKLEIAAKLAEDNNTLNIIEVTATEPNTNYGYVKLGQKTATIGETEVYELSTFVEKPDRETAEKFLTEGNYLWNTGIYVWKTSVLLDKYKIFQPESYRIISEIAEKDGQEAFKAVLMEKYPTLEKISIDYAIMEKVDPNEVRIIKANLGWSDIGNWEAVWEKQQKDKNGNALRGEVKYEDCQNCLIFADNNRPLKSIGQKDMVIVDTPEGLLISPKNESHIVKKLL